MAIDVISLPYHTLAFQRIGELYTDEINHSLTVKFATFRATQILARFPTERVLEGEKIWPEIKEILEALEAEMRKIASRRSVAYWLHMYRRIGPELSPNHESKTDRTTVALVRQIVELAIQKYGQLSIPKEFGQSNKLSPGIILGGSFHREKLALCPVCSRPTAV